MKFHTRIDCQIEIEEPSSPKRQIVIHKRYPRYLTLWEQLSTINDIRQLLRRNQIRLAQVSQSGRSEFQENHVVTQVLREYQIGLKFVEDSQTNRPIPMFSVVIRTTGNRMQSLERALICLAQQSFRNFEVIVVVSSLERNVYESVARAIRVNAVLMEIDTWIVHAESSGRTCPLNVGLLAARAEWIAFLDDDDYVLSNWLEIFASGAAKAHGREVLRQGVLSVRSGELNGQGGHDSLLGNSLTVSTEYCGAWSFLNSCTTNHTPIHGWSCINPKNAPGGVFFDDALAASEDWNYLMRLAARDGVRDLGGVGAIYNISAGESRKVETQTAWEFAFRLTREVLNSLSISLPSGWLADISSDLNENIEKRRGLQTPEHELEKVRREAAEVEDARYRTEQALKKLLRRSPLFALRHPARWWNLLISESR